MASWLSLVQVPINFGTNDTLKFLSCDITSLANKGVGVRVLMSLAGHRNISTTQAYIDINDDMLRRAAELV